MNSNRDNFSTSVINILGKRASYICSNPDCRASTIAPSEEDNEKFIYIGKAAHITAASTSGPRYDISLSSTERVAINNAIFLCSNCAEMIDKNNGIDFPVKLLLEWKDIHELWVGENLKDVNATKLRVMAKITDERVSRLISDHKVVNNFLSKEYFSPIDNPL